MLMLRSKWAFGRLTRHPERRFAVLRAPKDASFWPVATIGAAQRFGTTFWAADQLCFDGQYSAKIWKQGINMAMSGKRCCPSPSFGAVIALVILILYRDLWL